MKAPLNPNTAAHAHETLEHLVDKIAFARLCEKFDFDYVLLEQGNADLVMVRCCGRQIDITTGEVERSTRNLLRNIERNQSQGAKGTLILCQSFAVMGSVARKLAKSLTLSQATQVGVTNLAALQLLQPRLPNNPSTPTEMDTHT